jgi:putative sigma-54 modulation protein
MKIRVTARHLDLEPSLKVYVEEKINHLSRFFDRIDEAHVVISAEGHRRIADVTVHAARAIISSEQEADDVRAAFDRALERVERQLRRHKDRVRNMKHGPDTSEAAEMLGGAVAGSFGRHRPLNR